jgi:glycosyltransferase involved in cell wall biosynthesis
MEVEKSSASSSSLELLEEGEQSPQVSIVIPAYNAAGYISEALDSVFQQTFSDYEVIVINDGSPDTAQLELALQPFMSRIQYLKQENKGAAAARNTGIKIAQGSFIAFLDADDFWLPTYLESQIEFLQHSKVDLVYADAELIGDPQMDGRTYMETAPSSGQVSPESLLSLRCNVITSGVVARRRPIIEVGMFDESIKRGHDFDLWLRLAKHGSSIAYQRKVLLKHRVLESGLSGDLASQFQRALKVLRTIQQRGNLTSGEEATLKGTLARIEASAELERGKQLLCNRDFREAAKAIRAANRSQPSYKLWIALIALRISPNLLWRIYCR